MINSFRLEITEPAEFSSTTFGYYLPRHQCRRYDDVFVQCHSKYNTLETRLRHDTDMQMNFYDRWILPPILDLVIRPAPLEKYCREVVVTATGRVFEVGVGPGLNSPLYGRQVKIIFGIDPSVDTVVMTRTPRIFAWQKARKSISGSGRRTWRLSIAFFPWAWPPNRN